MSKSKRNGLIAVGVVMLSCYRFVAPFLDETKQMKEEARQVNEEILRVQTEADHYNAIWEKKMAGKEKQLFEQLPDSLNSSWLLEYFLTKFENMYPGKVVFLAVNRQNASLTDFKVGTGPKAARARAIRYKIKAQMGQDRVIPYIEHIEKFPGMFRIDQFDFSAIPGERLEMEITLEFYLAPSEWTPNDQVVAKKGDEEEQKGTEWHPVFLMKPVENKGDAKRKIAMEFGSKLPPRPHQIVGASVVIDETIYEEGDRVRGWTIQKVDTRHKEVLFRKGSRTEKVVVK